MSVTGIDLSEHNEFTPDLAGLSFVICRASIGTRKDYRYDQHAANVRAAGLLLGAYHYNWNSLPIGDQVDAFLAAAGDVDFYFIDVESNEAIPEGFTEAQTAEFIRQVQATGRKCGLYHSQSGWFDAGQDLRWVAKWSSVPPSIPWDFWQNDGAGEDGIDNNVWRGTLAELQALSYLAPPDSGTGGQTVPNITAVAAPTMGTAVITAADPTAARLDGSSVALAPGGSYPYIFLGDNPGPVAGIIVDLDLAILDRGLADFYPSAPPAAPAPPTITLGPGLYKVD